MPFCKAHRIVRDYLAPLSGVPKAAGFSNSGRLKVGPPAVRIFPAQEHVVAIDRGRFEVQALTESGKPSQSLRWWVVSQLERIDKQGRSKGWSKGKRQFVSSIGAFGRRNFGFSGKVSPGFYRLRVDIENSAKHRLARHQELFRAIPPTSDLRLTTNFSALSPGETGFLRVDNFGTLPARYGQGYQIFDSSGEEISLEGAVFSDTLLRLPAGYASPCFPFTAPSKISQGQYVIKVEAGDSPRGLGTVSAAVDIQ